LDVTGSIFTPSWLALSCRGFKTQSHHAAIMAQLRISSTRRRQPIANPQFAPKPALGFSKIPAGNSMKMT
jgi:hypothetical protein